MAAVITSVAVYRLTVGWPQQKPSQPPVPGGTAPGGSTAGSGFRAVEVTLRADPSEYSGRCPVEIRFSGRISVAGGGGTVSYRFLRSDSASAPVQTRDFGRPDSKSVSTTWTLGAATPRFDPFQGWQAIQILDPQPMESGRAAFTIRCR